MISRLTVATALIASVSISAAHAAPTLDGSGFGSPSATVTYDPAALSGNFGAPGTTTNAATYDIFVKSDATYGYVLVAENGGGAPAAGFFAICISEPVQVRRPRPISDSKSPTRTCFRPAVPAARYPLLDKTFHLPR
jgi:hypothetical protein